MAGLSSLIWTKLLNSHLLVENREEQVMKHNRDSGGAVPARSVFPDLAPVGFDQSEMAKARVAERLPRQPAVQPRLPEAVAATLGHMRRTTLSFSNMHQYGDLFVSLLKARKKIFIDRLHWSLPEAEGMEFDQYDTPLSRWIVVHEFGEILAGIRLTPTTARCGVYSYMLRDAQKGMLESIPTDVLFFKAPVNPRIWEASRVFVSSAVPAHRRLAVQSLLVDQLTRTARDHGATHVIGIVPAIWSRWLRRLDLSAVPVGPKLEIDGITTQCILFTVAKYVN
jgi:acyl homoserine lactone synthase